MSSLGCVFWRPHTHYANQGTQSSFPDGALKLLLRWNLVNALMELSLRGGRVLKRRPPNFWWPKYLGAASIAARRGSIRRLKLRQRILNANKDCPRSNPKFGFRALHAATTCGSSGGKGLVARSRCGVPTIIGWTQSTAIPAPILAPLGTKPARAHVALIWAQGFQGTG